MISQIDLENAYIKLYREFDKYIWTIDAVELLAEFEIAIYDRFPDAEEALRILHLLEYHCADILKENSDFKSAFDNMTKVLEEMRDEGCYANLISTHSLASNPIAQ